MPPTKRTTVSFSPRLYRALKVKAATTERGFSELVNEAVQLVLREDALDDEILRQRAKEPSKDYANVLRDLKRAHLI
jgi:hypothetical protein